LYLDQNTASGILHPTYISQPIPSSGDWSLWGRSLAVRRFSATAGLISTGRFRPMRSILWHSWS